MAPGPVVDLDAVGNPGVDEAVNDAPVPEAVPFDPREDDDVPLGETFRTEQIHQKSLSRERPPRPYDAAPPMGYSRQVARIRGLLHSVVLNPNRVIPCSAHSRRIGSTME